MTFIDRAIAAYLGLAIGDALGATVEFMTPHEIRDRYGVHDKIVGGGWLHLKPGQVTDDTTMSLALGASILEQGKVDALACAQAFDAWMRAKLRGVRRLRQVLRAGGIAVIPAQAGIQRSQEPA